MHPYLYENLFSTINFYKTNDITYEGEIKDKLLFMYMKQSCMNYYQPIDALIIIMVHIAKIIKS